MGTRVGSLERNVEFHEAILEVERQVAAAETVEKRVQDVEILLGGLVNDLQTISLEAECAVNWAEEGYAAELDRACSGLLGVFALLKVWVGEVTTSVQSDTEALRVLAGRATNLEQWGDELAASCNEVKDRVEYLGPVERRMHRRPGLSAWRGAKLASDDTKFGSY